jgi:hypothetical protein
MFLRATSNSLASPPIQSSLEPLVDQANSAFGVAMPRSGFFWQARST